MSKYSIEGQTLTDIADAIRAKTGDTAALTAAAMAEAIGSISGGGASNVVMGEIDLSDKAAGDLVEINIPYTGAGYPIAGMIFPTNGLVGGYRTDSKVLRNSILMCAFGKYISTRTPTYADAAIANGLDLVVWSKYSTSTEGLAARSNFLGYYSTMPDGSGAIYTIRFLANTKMVLKVISDGYGYSPQIPYSYIIIYSE